MFVASYLDHLAGLERRLASILRDLAPRPALGRRPEGDDLASCLAAGSDRHAHALAAWAARFPRDASPETAAGPWPGPFPPRANPGDAGARIEEGIELAGRVQTAWAILVEAARDLGDTALAADCARFAGETRSQLAWLAGEARLVSARGRLEPSRRA